MYREGLISREEALLGVDAKMMDYFLHPTIDPKATRTVAAKVPKTKKKHDGGNTYMTMAEYIN